VDLLVGKRRLKMKLDKAFELAVILAWENLMKVSRSPSVRVEYQCEPGTSLEYVKVWAAKPEGYNDLVCNYWTWTSSAHAKGVRFANGYHSDTLALTLDFIMKNQDQFTRPVDACRDGLVLVYPPTEAERREASNWRGEVQGTATNFGGSADERVPLLWMSLTDGSYPR
jgi:hypothetical protein